MSIHANLCVIKKAVMNDMISRKPPQGYEEK